MRSYLLTGWLLLPAMFAAWHYGPGQDYLKLDDAAALLKRAERSAAENKWDDAVLIYEQALTALPDEADSRKRRIRLELAKAKMLAKRLPESHDELEGLVEELTRDEHPDAQLLSEARSALASSQYYMTWLMRLEGLARDEWEPVIESSRQNYRLLAEEALKQGKQSEVGRHQQDLESAIRLARMDLKDLQGLPLPSQ